MIFKRFFELTLHIPPEETWSTLVHNPDYILAFHYFLFNMGLLLLAWLLGTAGIQLIDSVYCTRSTQQQDSSTTRPFTLPLSADIFFKLCIGIAIIIATIFVLALFHWLEKKILFSVLACLAVIAVSIKTRRFFTRNPITNPLKNSKWKVWADIIFVVLMMLIIFSLPTGPTPGDSTSFHAPYADFFLKHHGLAVNEFMIYPYHTFNLNILFSMGLMLAHDLVYLQSIHGLFAVLTMLGLYGFSRAMRLQPLICLSMPFLFLYLYVIRYNLNLANVDLAGMCFSFATFLSLWCWSESKNRSYLVIAAICLGITIGTKYILCAMIVPAILALFLLEPRNFLRNAALCAVWVLAWGSWWYVRNAILIGNPVHPFAPGIFGYQIWTAADMASQLSASNAWMPKSFLGLLSLPFYAYHSETLLSQDIFLLLVLLFFSTIFSYTLPTRINILLLAAWCWTISWVWGSQDPRHFLPAAPLVFLHFSILISNTFDFFFKGTFNFFHIKNKKTHTAVQCIFAIPAVILAILVVRAKIITIYYYHPTFSTEYQAELRKNSSTYDLAMAANQFFTDKETIYEFQNRDAYWFFKGRMVGTQFGPHGYWTIAQASTKPGYSGMQPDQLQRVLQERYSAVGFIIPNPPLLPYNQAAFDAYFKLLYRNVESSIYRFKISPQ